MSRLHIYNLSSIAGLCFAWVWSTGECFRQDAVSEADDMQRIEHYLENLPQGADWREFCATTPASFRGMHFIGAEFCFQKVRCSVTPSLVRFIDYF
jgi:hypothetical protein